MRKIKRQIVSALIFSADNKLLLGMKDHRQGGVYNDCWHIPGGGVDEKEELITALKREVLEEVGIDVSGYDVNLIDDEGRGISEKILKSGEKVMCEMDFHVYEVKIHNKKSSEIKIILNADLVKYRWTDIQDLKKIKLTPPSINLFTRLNYI